MKYVCGFAFSEDLQEVLLIKKKRPDWQKGLMNGIGGKIENVGDIDLELEEFPIQAMIREFKEETGVELDKWYEFALIEGEGYVVHFFMSVSNRIFDAKDMTDEAIVRILVSELFKYKTLTLSNLQWLIPMAIDNSVAFGTFIPSYGY